MGRQLPCRLAPKHRQTHGDEQVLQQVKVALDRLSADTAVRGHRLHVEDGALGQARCLEEAVEARDVPDQAFLLDFLP